MSVLQNHSVVQTYKKWQLLNIWPLLCCDTCAALHPLFMDLLQHVPWDCEMKVSRVISAVQLWVCLIEEVRPSGVFPPWELQTQKVSHLIQMVQHLRTKTKSQGDYTFESHRKKNEPVKCQRRIVGNVCVCAPRPASLWCVLQTGRSELGPPWLVWLESRRPPLQFSSPAFLEQKPWSATKN